jgi:hypothetical protein
MSGGDGVAEAGWFFDLPFRRGEVEVIADRVCNWLRSESLRWLVENVPGRRRAGGPVEPLRWADEPVEPAGAEDGVARLLRVLAGFGQICDWKRPGTAWDYRQGGERLFEEDRAALHDLTGEVAARATALGLRSEGGLRTGPRTAVVLGGRRLAPLNRTRAAARAMRRQPGPPPRVVMLCGHRPLDALERESEEVRSYAPSARTERDLMAAAASEAFGEEPAVEVELVEVPDPEPGARASTYETLRAIAENPALARGPVAVATSPTCRPFQYLEAARALGLPHGLTCELIAHPPAWAAASLAQAEAPHAPHVYLQEIRSVIQAAGRFARALSASRASA